MRKFAIACDHGGVELKEAIKAHFSDKIDFIDCEVNTSESVHYPEYGAALARTISAGQAEQGILICGSGIGISIAANRFPHIRAALCMDKTMARLSREHNDANVVALGARLIDQETAFDIIETFLNTEFEGGRHVGRVEQLANLK